MMAKGRSKKEIEQLLASVLVPVEPDREFLQKLQARLVTYHGRKVINGWMVVAILTTTALLAISALGMVMRLLVTIAGIVGILANRRRSSTRSSTLAM
jgi:hypothetical protein